MAINYCPQCGHLLSKSLMECSYCYWSQYDYQLDTMFDTDNIDEHHSIDSVDYDDIDRLINNPHHDSFETLY
jgi:hypothetical protein